MDHVNTVQQVRGLKRLEQVELERNVFLLIIHALQTCGSVWRPCLFVTLTFWFRQSKRSAFTCFPPNVSSDAPGPALSRQFPPGDPVAGVVHHATHHHPPHGNPGGSSMHQPEPGQFHQGLTQPALTHWRLFAGNSHSWRLGLLTWLRLTLLQFLFRTLLQNRNVFVVSVPSAVDNALTTFSLPQRCLTVMNRGFAFGLVNHYMCHFGLRDPKVHAQCTCTSGHAARTGACLPISNLHLGDVLRWFIWGFRR